MCRLQQSIPSWMTEYFQVPKHRLRALHCRSTPWHTDNRGTLVTCPPSTQTPPYIILSSCYGTESLSWLVPTFEAGDSRALLLYPGSARICAEAPCRRFHTLKVPPTRPSSAAVSSFSRFTGLHHARSIREPSTALPSPPTTPSPLLQRDGRDELEGQRRGPDSPENENEDPESGPESRRKDEKQNKKTDGKGKWSWRYVNVENKRLLVWDRRGGRLLRSIPLRDVESLVVLPDQVRACPSQKRLRRICPHTRVTVCLELKKPVTRALLCFPPCRVLDRASGWCCGFRWCIVNPTKSVPTRTVYGVSCGR